MANKQFDSKFEKELNKGVLSHCEFHPKEKVEYVVPKKYSPDFKWTDSKGFTYLIEAKGRFEDNYESSKYKHIREQLPENTELVFLFQTPKLPMPRAAVRKDGTKATHSEWATRNEFRWFDKNTIQELFKMKNKDIGRWMIELDKSEKDKYIKLAEGVLDGSTVYKGDDIISNYPSAICTLSCIILGMDSKESSLVQVGYALWMVGYVNEE